MEDAYRRRRREKIQDYINASRKSPVAGVIYTLLFGPFGCICTNPWATLIALFIAVGLGLIYWPLIAPGVGGLHDPGTLPGAYRQPPLEAQRALSRGLIARRFPGFSFLGKTGSWEGIDSLRKHRIIHGSLATGA